MVRGDVVDPLDDYMASLKVPPGDQLISVAQERLECTSRQSTGCGTSCSLSMAVKNRRYRRLQQLLEDTSEDRYFSDDMMQQRSPALFHFYLGQYSGLDGTTRPVVAKTELTLSTFLIDTHQRSEMEARRVAEQATWGQFIALNERLEQHRLQELYDVEHVEEEEEDEEQDEEQDKEYEDVVAVDAVDERREQLVEVMCIRFLTGKDDEYVNYAEIDEDEGLDDFEAMQRDAEDRYFADGTDAS
uniref:CCD97-like C-terminal domain-containing protein n=1 Tax=Hyaloperonospora arabidopsidis (strain Emoy2) TaxID=559515 RepID=M4BCY8_HYAAE